VRQPVATSTPSSATNVASLGSTDPQPLPTVAGFGGTVTFPRPAVTASASPKASATPAPQPTTPVAIGLTMSIVEPTDAPKFASPAKHGLFGHHTGESTGPKALVFISLMATGDVNFGSYPRFAIDVPRDLVAKYRDSAYELALFDPATKEKSYRLAVAERDYSTPVPGTHTAAPTLPPTPAPTPVPSPSLTPSPHPSGIALPGVLTPPPFPKTPEPGPTLPPERISFTGPATKLALKANRAVVFALYVIPAPSPEPSAKPAAAKPSAIPSPVPSAAPSAAASAAPSPTAS
jgi:hypothetical protein